MAESGSLSLVQGEEPNKVNTVPALWLAPVSPSRVTAYLVTLACAFYTFLVQIMSWGAASCFLTGQMALTGVTCLHPGHSLPDRPKPVLEPESPGRPPWLQTELPVEPSASEGQCGQRGGGAAALLAPALLLATSTCFSVGRLK